MKFFGDFGAYLNCAIQEIDNEDANSYSIETSDLVIQSDGMHFTGSGTRIIADRYITSFGLNSVVATSDIEKVLVLGNSIVSSGADANIGWAGNWGMASSSADKTFMSILTNYYKNLNAGSVISGYNVAGVFEANYKTVDVLNGTYFDAVKNDNAWTTIIIRLGENIPMDSYDGNILKQKLADVVTKVSNGRAVKVIITNCFWTNSGKDATFREFALANNYRFADLTGIYGYRNSNTAWNNTNNAVLANATDAVKDHPSDAGMAQIASKIINSATITVQASGTVTTTQPNRIANYYKSASGNSEIIRSYAYSTSDIVYLSNDKIKVGINLRYGGAITYLSAINSSVNMVNNGQDGGRQIQPDYYQKPTNYTQNGKTPIPSWANNGYNTTLGGDYNRNTATLLDYHAIADGYYVKFKPVLWGFDGELSEIIVEATYTLVGNSVKCVYNYINQRTDNQIPSGVTFNGWALPVCYLNQAFTQFYAYTGDAPFTNGGLAQSTVPSTGNAEAFSKEFWSAMVNPTTGIGVGVYNKMPNHTDSYFQYSQANPYAGFTDEFSDSCTIFQTLDTFSTPDSQTQWNRQDTAHLIVGSISEIRTKAYQIHSS